MSRLIFARFNDDSTTAHVVPQNIPQSIAQPNAPRGHPIIPHEVAPEVAHANAPLAKLTYLPCTFGVTKDL